MTFKKCSKSSVQSFETVTHNCGKLLVVSKFWLAHLKKSLEIFGGWYYDGMLIWLWYGFSWLHLIGEIGVFAESETINLGSTKYIFIQELCQDNLWFLILNKCRFHQFSEIMETNIITILALLHNTILQRSRGLLSDAQVRILIRPTVFR